MGRIDRFTSRAQAELACGLLRANGFDARISGDDAGGVHPDIPFGIGGTAIVVPDDQVDQATALLDENRMTADDAGAASEPFERSSGVRQGPGLRMIVAIALVALIVIAAVVTTTSSLFG